MPQTPSAVDSEFDRVDIDKDGVITRDEFHAAYAAPGSPLPPSPTGGQTWETLSKTVQVHLKPHDRFQSGIVKEDVFLKALEHHGIDPRHPGIARVLEYSSDSGHVMYKQFFRDALSRDKQGSSHASPARSPNSPETFGTPVGVPPSVPSSMPYIGIRPSGGVLGSPALDLDSAMSAGDDKQKLAKARISNAELRMEVESMRDALVDADVERKGAELELQSVRKQLRESRTLELQAMEDEMKALRRHNQMLKTEIAEERENNRAGHEQIKKEAADALWQTKQTHASASASISKDTDVT